MTDPLAVLPFAIAAAGGRIDGIEAARLVAAGVALLQRSAPLVRALRGRRAAILLPTGPAYLTALAACEGRGAVLVNPLAAPPEIAVQLADADVGAVLTVAALADRLPPDVVRVLLDGAPRTARIVAADGAAADVPLVSAFPLDLAGDPETPGLDEEAAIVYTSAMAGRPLGAILTHGNLLSNARATVDAARLGPHDHALAVLPFAHLFGLVVAAVAPLLAGGRVTTSPRFHAARAAESLAGGDVTVLVGVPSVFAALLAALERRAAESGAVDVGALRLCICGGAPLAPELQRRWHAATGVELRQGYGLTEAGPVCLFNRVDLPNRVDTLGVPFPGIAVEVRDPATGTPLADGVEGELCVRGTNVFAGYVSGAAAGLGRTPDGSLRTGDLGVRHDDGTFAFRGLLKPMFTRNGFNIYPRELERVVGAMPGVRSVAARGVPEPTKEHDIVLDVGGDVSEADVRAWCAANLAAYKQPTTVRVSA